MAKEQSATKERQRTDLREPRRYKVTIYNDDFTTMEFVVNVLESVFFKPHDTAVDLMMTIHNTGEAVVGIYSRDIAESKAQKAMDLAEQQGFPLKLTCSPE